VLDVIVEVVGGILRSIIPDRQPWRGLVLAFASLSVVGAVVVLILAV
jgi:hypothetical protein